MPLATGGALFEKTAPVKHLDPVKHLQKLLIKAVMICSVKGSMQTMTAFGSFKVVKKENEGFDTPFVCKFQ